MEDRSHALHVRAYKFECCIMSRYRYQSLTVKRKLEIIDKGDSLPPGKQKKDIASEFGILQNTLSTILKDKDKLCASYAVSNTKQKCHREPTQPDIDAALFQWFTATRAQSSLISGQILMVKAEELGSIRKQTGPALVDG